MRRQAEDQIDTPVLTVKDVAAILSVSHKTVQRWADDGLLPVAFVTPGGHRRFDRAEVRRFQEGLAEPTAVRQVKAATESFEAANDEREKLRLGGELFSAFNALIGGSEPAQSDPRFFPGPEFDEEWTRRIRKAANEVVDLWAKRERDRARRHS